MIEVKHIQKKFGRKTVLKDISFHAKEGHITCLIGINGSGKTTILKSIMNLMSVNRGEILIDGHQFTESMYEKVAYVPDVLTMPLHMKIKDVFQFMRDFYKSWNDQRADELLTFFKLDKNERLKNLSKGNLAKANMLFGLALDVDYILLDEPFSGIDMFSREQIANVFTTDLVEGRGVILTTHEIRDIEYLIDEVVLLNNGFVVNQFNVEQMREEQGKSIVDVMREVLV